MKPHGEDLLRKACRLTSYIGFAILESLFLYAVVEIIKKRYKPFGGFSPMKVTC